MIAKVVTSCCGLIEGEEYEVESVSMGQNCTYVRLLNPKPMNGGNLFNSVTFDFYEDGKKIDIYKDKRYNPYL